MRQKAAALSVIIAAFPFPGLPAATDLVFGKRRGRLKSRFLFD
ncbi:hypothetical protein HMPREF9123_0722 [Neisseria bacilliformis ATCC BAA-1200]|uniref:Uncharacterized protein n=1 Tax=Neisseria bacilliformis ATCC BAA-1200 TaxID=888742 RepID=F2BAB8_9NEIS|nr:hypothetical protein HMPREF9123_0722 [Neisseria bacilliformis ATCC BAA-1200]